MPNVTKQTATVPRKVAPSANGKAGGVLSRIQPVKSSNLGRLKCSLYGLPKSGKTRLACTFPKPLLVIGFEDGTASIAGAKGTEFVLLQSTSELTELVNGPIAEGRWASVVVDHATKMRDMRVSELFDVMGMAPPDKKPFMFADAVWKTVWQQCAKDMKDLLAPLLDLPNKRELNVVIIAQEQNFGGGEEGAPTSDVIKPAIGSALGKSLCIWLNAECDYVCQTFIREETKDKITKSKIGNKEVTNTEQIKTGRKQFCLRVGPHETYITGFRVPLGRELPNDVIVDPSYEKIAAIIG